MTKYRTEGVLYDVKATITPVEVERETDHCIWVKESWSKKRWVNKATLRRISKISEDHRYYDTWEDAKDFLLAEAERHVAETKKKLEYHQSQLEKVTQLKKEEE